MQISKAKVIASITWGWIFTVVGGLFVFSALLYFIEDGGVEGVGIFMFIPFFLIMRGGIRTIMSVRRFKKYVFLISSQQMNSITSLAAERRKSTGFIQKDFQKMIDKGYFTKAKIDYTTNEIIIGNCSVTVQGNSSPEQLNVTASTETESFSCKGCGASGTKLKNTLSNCDYCGNVV